MPASMSEFFTEEFLLSPADGRGASSAMPAGRGNPRRRAAANDAASEKRALRSLDVALSIAEAYHSGISTPLSENGGISSVRCLYAVVTKFSPSNGLLPVTS